MIRLYRPRRQRPHRAVRRWAGSRRQEQEATQPPAAPEDATVYACACGNTFTAAVTATVTCPVCGDGQVW
jgi:rubrerythrin